MKIAVLKERHPYETRVAASPDSVKKYKALGLDVVVETGAGAGASFTDEAFQAQGAEIASSPENTTANADIVLKVRRPQTQAEGLDELSLLKSGQILIAMLDPLGSPDLMQSLAQQGVIGLAMELMPRITRAQSMDVLSSQSNLSGYRAVIEAASVYGRAFPMMMTAAGTIAPARCTIMGAGVAGLQAIATARRLGAIVSAFDVRAAAKEQVQSLGATFIEVEGGDGETKAGYAKEMDEDYKRRQQEKVHETLKKQNIVITTALIPGRAAPKLIFEKTVEEMQPGSVIVDLAAEQGGNCALTEAGKIVDVNGVKIVGYVNLAGSVPTDASNLFAKNLLTFLQSVLEKGENGPELKIDWEDEIMKGICITRDGAVVHPALQGGN